MEKYFGYELRDYQINSINQLREKNNFFVKELLMGKGSRVVQ